MPKQTFFVQPNPAPCHSQPFTVPHLDQRRLLFSAQIMIHPFYLLSAEFRLKNIMDAA